MAFISEFGKNILHECSTKDNPIYLLFPKQTLVHLLTFIIDDLLKMAFFWESPVIHVLLYIYLLMSLEECTNPNLISGRAVFLSTHIKKEKKVFLGVI